MAGSFTMRPTPISPEVPDTITSSFLLTEDNVQSYIQRHKRTDNASFKNHLAANRDGMLTCTVDSVDRT
ncbi:uncharacterized protein N7443_004876 [Penicillium atrosanguineum]|uniref:Uncharacterized protein n=1 Tax=Penicillium atrosanguineum TaxID=1132637 RepID=A0A9W9Q9D8_9EURO|nr:uncharacterized protein N7443_004876 [Penicillium atrosanguineum]KAJ5133493.1 hypothetical protein N7526_004858 [Penicillium atrosanguineum]KAJ5305216.1 hypothetical protein N7443_004876 [Penicillium atrosanguineum]KAJ5324681.1 hypothetical protein N7476_003281 [Penicillium atrosanguineum]